MVMIVVDNAPQNIRGELTKWFLELKPGVFAGNVNTRIRELLWERVCTTPSSNGAVRVLSIRIEKKVNYFYEVTTSD